MVEIYAFSIPVWSEIATPSFEKVAPLGAAIRSNAVIILKKN